MVEGEIQYWKIDDKVSGAQINATKIVTLVQSNKDFSKSNAEEPNTVNPQDISNKQ